MLLARRGVRATFVTATHAHLAISTTAKAANNSSNNDNMNVRFAPTFDGFDPATVDIFKPDYPQHLQEHGSRSLADILLSLAASGQPVDCVVYNFLLPWVADVASELAIPSALLWIQPVTLLAIYYHFLHQSPHLFLDLYKEIKVPGLPLSLNSDSLPSFLFPDNPFILSLPLLNHMFQGIKESKSRWVLVNSFESLEAETLSSLKDLHILPITVGPLVPAAYVSKKDHNDSCFGGDLVSEKRKDDGGTVIVDWLNSKPPVSVVYVSFGSMATLTEAQIDEIAYGLIESGHYLIWVVRHHQRTMLVYG
ncbi:Crocetin glucosyltransferase [Nymphaea thermarum]|nr:Crocetin glucosyltransferase [Nymphaea thermarum]